MPALEVASGFGTDWGAGGFGAATAGRSGAAFRWTCSGACCEAAGRGVGIAGLGAGEAGANGRGVPDAAAACMCTAGCVALAEDAAARRLDGVWVETGGWAGFDVALAGWAVAAFGPLPLRRTCAWFVPGGIRRMPAPTRVTVRRGAARPNLVGARAGCLL